MPLLAPAGDWNYSGNPASSDLDLMRYLIQDVDDTVRLVSDTEINYELAEWTPKLASKYAIAAEIAERVSVKFAGVTTVAADGVNVDLSSLAERYLAVAKSLRAQAEREVSSDDIDMAALGVCQVMDPSIRPLSFSVGFQDNPAAGNQQFGGQPIPTPDRDDTESYGY